MEIYKTKGQSAVYQYEAAELKLLCIFLMPCVSLKFELSRRVLLASWGIWHRENETMLETAGMWVGKDGLLLSTVYSIHVSGTY